ncbi:MAG: hypothetical protein ACHQYQ_00340 [Bacteriovoracales bacterium]
MKKVLFFFSLLISCLSNAQEVIYSLPEINSKIHQSSVLTSSGKEFLVDFFEFHAPLDSDLGDLSQWVCEESASQKTKLFISKRKCEENFELFLANYEKSVDININVDVGPEGRIRGGSVGVNIKIK